MLVIGLSHHTAPIEIRERVALDDEAARNLLTQIVGQGTISEAMVVSTCNRLELYLVPEGDEDGAVEVALDALKFSRADVGKVLYLRTGADAACHLFRVASSLDSLVVGEPQILGQIKRGLERARSVGTVGNQLNRVATRALRAAKRVRTETTIGSGQVSIASVALDLARQIFDQLKDRVVALVGSGEMGEAIAHLLRQSGARLVLLGRNEQRVHELANRVGAEGRLLTQLESTLEEADVVVTSTSASLPIIRFEQVRQAMKHRRGRDLFFVDVAVPRDVEERVGKLSGVYLYNVDDLSNVVAETHASRSDEALRAERVVAEELKKLAHAHESEQVTPTVRALYDWFGRVMRAEVERSLHGSLKGLAPAEREAVVRLADAATKKLLHNPSTTLRRWAVERPVELDAAVELIRELFLPDGTGNTEEDIKSLPKSDRIVSDEADSPRVGGIPKDAADLMSERADPGRGQ
jgi:glutamyl-tRNA reductase